jgi:hypothetical protein
VALSALVGLSLLLAGCKDSPTPTAAPTTTTKPTVTTSSNPTPTTVAADPTTDIVARYKMYWLVRFEANQAPPNPDLPTLAEYATGQQLDKVRAETRDNLQHGLALRHAQTSVARSSVKVLHFTDTEATLQECVVDDGVVYRYASGEVVNADVATQSVEATMQKVDGVWKLAAAYRLQRWEGVKGCALSSGFSSS